MGSNNRLTEAKFNRAKAQLREGRSTAAVASRYHIGCSTARQIQRARNWQDYQRRFVLPKREQRKQQSLAVGASQRNAGRRSSHNSRHMGRTQPADSCGGGKFNLALLWLLILAFIAVAVFGLINAGGGQ